MWLPKPHSIQLEASQQFVNTLRRRKCLQYCSWERYDLLHRFSHRWDRSVNTGRDRQQIHTEVKLSAVQKPLAVWTAQRKLCSASHPKHTSRLVCHCNGPHGQEAPFRHTVTYCFGVQHLTLVPAHAQFEHIFITVMLSVPRWWHTFNVCCLSVHFFILKNKRHMKDSTSCWWVDPYSSWGGIKGAIKLHHGRCSSCDLEPYQRTKVALILTTLFL